MEVELKWSKFKDKEHWLKTLLMKRFDHHIFPLHPRYQALPLSCREKGEGCSPESETEAVAWTQCEVEDGVSARRLPSPFTPRAKL